MYLYLFFAYLSLECKKSSGDSETFIQTQASLVAKMVKNLPVMQETWVWSLGREDTVEKGMEALSSILAWEISYGQRSLAGHSPWGRKELDMTEQLTLSLFTNLILF